MFKNQYDGSKEIQFLHNIWQKHSIFDKLSDKKKSLKIALQVSKLAFGHSDALIALNRSVLQATSAISKNNHCCRIPIDCAHKFLHCQLQSLFPDVSCQQ